MNVAYFTDVEGNWEYLASFVALSEALKRDGENEDGSMRLQLNDGWRIVFGGDSCDKGGVVGGSASWAVRRSAGSGWCSCMWRE